ncbi:hypothetical protein RAS1_29010 [Phycisphaerae bacterium RAS1]|nr:hypothetical protein RAS1_29010 [Phycisphaerae bacterium RAS1]
MTVTAPPESPAASDRTDSGRAVARALGVTEKAFRKWRRHPAWPWPAMPADGWSIREVRAWRSRTLPPPIDAGQGSPTTTPPPPAAESDARDPTQEQPTAENGDAAAAIQPDLGAAFAGMGAERIARLQHIVARRVKIELETAILSGQYMRRQTVLAEWAGRARAVNRALDDISRAIVAAVAGLTDPTDIERAVTAQVDFARAAFMEGMQHHE